MGAGYVVQTGSSEGQAGCAKRERSSEEDQSQNNSFCPPARMRVDIFHEIFCSALARLVGFSGCHKETVFSSGRAARYSNPNLNNT